jgi:hypothetical protein
MKETYNSRVTRLQAEGRAFARSMYGWGHPENVAWAASRDIAGADTLRGYCRRLENRLRDLEVANRQHRADSVAEPWLEDVRLPGHRGRPDMAVQDRVWLVDPSNRSIVIRIWGQLQAATLTITGNYGNLSGDLLEGDGVPETLVSHWRSIDYTATGERIEKIPGGMIARDLDRLGLGLADIQAGTVNTPRRRPRAAPRPQPRRAPPQRQAAEVQTEPVVIRRRGSGGTHAG